MAKNTETTENTKTTITEATGTTDNNSKPKISAPRKSPINITRKQGIAGLVVILVIVVGFVAGIHYERKHQESVNDNRTSMRAGRFGNSSNGFGGPNGRMGTRGGMRSGVFGQVTAVSATSITVKNTRSGSDSTLAVNSSTTVTNDGQTAAIGDVKVGDNVIVRTSSTDNKTATQINLNPQMRGPGSGGMSGGAQSQSTPQVPTQTN